jgi:hypothetical protein
MIIKTDCGLVQTNDLLTVRKPYESTSGWVVILKYDGIKDDIVLYADNEEEARNCYGQISDAIIDMQTPKTGTIAIRK